MVEIFKAVLGVGSGWGWGFGWSSGVGSGWGSGVGAVSFNKSFPPLTPKLLSPPAARAKASIASTLAYMLLMWPPSVKLAEDRLTPFSPFPPACGPPAAVSSRALRSVPFKMACCN